MERSVQAQLVRLEVPEDGRQTGEETAVFLVVSLLDARRAATRATTCSASQVQVCPPWQYHA